MNTPEEFAMRCKTATDSLPEARYREHLERLHRDMLEALAALSAENAALKADRDSWIEQCSQRVEDWHKEHLMVNALKADAERYRWLTANHRYDLTLKTAFEIATKIHFRTKDSTDAAIDAAMKETQ
jgi:hypothetical protein